MQLYIITIRNKLFYMFVIVLCRLKSVAKSVSIPLGRRPRELRGSKIVAKRKLEMKRPVHRTTGHTTDYFSNCIKRSKIPLRSYKKL